ncbi:alpha/beta hydrolase family protein [Caldalkalibacillus salinus]|uniref:S9 family peptidase n=1 Tax=Caldalkalibacillus salinus TaxID=2803787 RepID=UPI0019207DC6|nr:S9 family peptidase [Caldalkalibacillus salinus]
MGKRAITAEDLLKFKFVGDPQTSPDGTRVAYVLTQIDGEKDGYYSSIYVTDLEDEGRPYTYQYKADQLIRDTTPKWSPNGKTLAFLSNRTGKKQIWLLPVDGGEAKPLTDVPNGVLEYQWSPDGKRMVITTKGDAETTSDTQTNATGEDSGRHEDKKSDVIEITRLRYKADGVGIHDDKRKQVYLFSIEDQTWTRLTDETYDFTQPSFSPDGKKVLYVGSKDQDIEERQIPSLWQFDLATGEENLLYEGNGIITSPTYSPDGQWVAFAGHNRGWMSSGNVEVWLVPTTGGKAHKLTSDLDHPVGNLVGVDAKYDTAVLRLIWSPDSQDIYFYATVGGDCKLFKTNIEGQVSEALTPAQANVSSFDLINEQRAVVVLGHPQSTGDLVVQDLDSVDERQQLTDWNGPLLSEIALSEPEQIKYTSTDGLEIEGWLLKPYPFQEGQQYPLILQIHGGPHTAYGNGLHHEMQLMAAKGYVVLYTNPRGSHGYGHDFVRAVVGDYSGMDYEDLMAGVDYVIENKDYVDTDQLFVTGGSYGGYMTNVIVTKTDRFKAAVTQRSICNWHSFYGTSDIGYFFTWYQHGKADLWADEEKLLAISPLRYAKNVQTPTLIVHSEEDLRCPMEQAEQWYVALKRLGVETKFVRFPDENHDLSRSGKPQHRLERLDHIINWFEARTEKKVSTQV